MNFQKMKQSLKEFEDEIRQYEGKQVSQQAIIDSLAEKKKQCEKDLIRLEKQREDKIELNNTLDTFLRKKREDFLEERKKGLAELEVEKTRSRSLSVQAQNLFAKAAQLNETNQHKAQEVEELKILWSKKTEQLKSLMGN